MADKTAGLSKPSFRQLSREQLIDVLRSEIEKETHELLRAMDNGEVKIVLRQVDKCASLYRRVRHLHNNKVILNYLNSAGRKGSRTGFHWALLTAAEEEGLPISGANLRYQCGPVQVEVDPEGLGVKIDGKLYSTYRVKRLIKIIRRRLDSLGKSTMRQWSTVEFREKLLEAYNSLTIGRSSKDVLLIEIYRWLLKDSGSNGMVYSKRVFAEDLSRLWREPDQGVPGFRLSLDPVRDSRLTFIVTDSTGKERPVGSIRLTKEA